MKQVLSVADFVTIINLLDKRIDDIIRNVCTYIYEKELLKSGFVKEIPTLSDSRVQEELKNHLEYQELINLRYALHKLNIEVETPDIEISDEE